MVSVHHYSKQCKMLVGLESSILSQSHKTLCWTVDTRLAAVKGQVQDNDISVFCIKVQWLCGTDGSERLKQLRNMQHLCISTPYITTWSFTVPRQKSIYMSSHWLSVTHHEVFQENRPVYTAIYLQR